MGHALLGYFEDRHTPLYVPTKSFYDLRRQEDCFRMMADYKPEIVIHAAATVGGIGANQEKPGKFFYDNLLMGINIVESSRVFGVEKIVMISTTCAYPCHTEVPFQEDALWQGYPELTNSGYGIAKRVLLTMCQAYKRQYGLKFVYLIPSNMYGPHDHFNPQTSHVIPAIIQKCCQAVDRGENIVLLWGDGTPTREFLYVGDAAEAIYKATKMYEGCGPVNIGTGEEISIFSLANKIAELTSFTGKFIYEPSRPNGQPRRCLDTTKALIYFDFKATTKLEDGLRKTIEWYKTNKEKLYA